jgi:proline iminopeptidase
MRVLPRGLDLALAPAFLAVLFMQAGTGCGPGSNDETADASTITDAGDITPDDDGGVSDGGGARDGGGTRDAGFSDPETLVQGVETIGDLATYVHVLGTLTSTQPPVIILHMGPELSHEYLPEPMRFLVPGRVVVFYDMRATGRTSFGGVGMNETLTIDHHKRDLAEVVDWVRALSGGAPQVNLIGHGYGAGVAMLYAAERPAEIRHMVLVAPFPATSRQLADFRAESARRLTTTDRQRINQLEMQPDCRGNASRCTLEVWSIAGKYFVCEAHRELFQALRFEHGSPRARDFVELALRESSYDWRPVLGTVDVPTTVISGPCDPVPATTPETYTSSIAGAVHHVLEGTGHFPMIEAPATFQSIVLDALAP